MHFMNPVPVMNLVEVIPGLATSAETLESTMLLAAKMGKICTQSQDVPGFIANRLLMPYINEAVVVLEQVSNLCYNHIWKVIWLQLSAICYILGNCYAGRH